MSIPPRVISTLALAAKQLEHAQTNMNRVRGVAHANKEEHLQMGIADLAARIDKVRIDLASLKGVIAARMKEGGE
ncbi:MAG TPA: hypothetical protein VJW20_20370 [Candidatus Angelobacter sp.]|nr:hypothetical protein [Candidatus Angelobacter sp.]